MKNIIYSIYIENNEPNLNEKHQFTKTQLAKHYQKLIDVKKEYASEGLTERVLRTKKKKHACGGLHNIIQVCHYNSLKRYQTVCPPPLLRMYCL